MQNAFNSAFNQRHVGNNGRSFKHLVTRRNNASSQRVHSQSLLFKKKRRVRGNMTCYKISVSSVLNMFCKGYNKVTSHSQAKESKMVKR